MQGEDEPLITRRGTIKVAGSLLAAGALSCNGDSPAKRAERSAA